MSLDFFCCFFGGLEGRLRERERGGYGLCDEQHVREGCGIQHRRISAFPSFNQLHVHVQGH